MYLITPLFLVPIKLNLGLYLPAFFKIFFYLILYFLAFLLYLIPDIIIDHPVIFILTTTSNITTLYIAYLSTFDKNINLRENIIHLFNILKEYKFHPFKLLKYIVIHLKKWINIKFKQLKDNLFSILLTLFIIIFIANVFRQPIFIYLGEDIFSNFYLYMYVMFSSILPTNYTVTILIKLLKTKKLDLSFRLVDFKDNITILSLLFLIISLYISYFYIWPLIGFSIIYFIQSKAIFLDLILNPKNIQGLHLPRLMILPGLTVAEVFGFFGSSFTRDEILSTIEKYEPNTNDANPSGELTKYSDNKWISKIAISENIETNAEDSRKNIKTPYIPVEYFKSYRNNFEIGNNLMNNTLDKNIPINMALYYLKGEDNFYHHVGVPGQLFDLGTNYLRNKHSILITQSDKPLSWILKQICINSSQPTSHTSNHYFYNTIPFVILCHKERISFFLYRPSPLLEQIYPFKKGRTFHNINNPIMHIDTPNICGIIGLVATTWGVETIPQQNVYKPQLAFYDTTNEKHAFAIHMIFKYISINKFKLEWEHNCTSLIHEKVDPVNLTENLHGEDELNIKIKDNGELIRER